MNQSRERKLATNRTRVRPAMLGAAYCPVYAEWRIINEYEHLDLRRKIKKAVDRVPPKRLESLADYVEFLNRPPLMERVESAERAIAAGKGTNWRKARSDV